MTQTTEISIEQLINAPKSEVFKAWTDADLMRKWFAPAGVDVYDAAVTLTVGGELRIVMGKGGETDTAIGTFKEIVPSTKLRFSWGLEGNSAVPVSEITVYLKDAASGETRVVLVQSGLPNDAPQEVYIRAWSGILAKLRELYTSRSGGCGL